MRCWLLIVLALAQSAWGGAGIERIRFEQVVSDGHDIWVYLDARSSDGRAVSMDRIGNLQVYVGGEEASFVSLEPFSDSGQGVGYIFLVDVSKSLRETNYARIRQALADWVDAMKPGDMAAVVTFGSSVEPVLGFTHDRDRLKSAVSGLGPRDQQTLLYEGLKEATALGAQHRIDPSVPRRKLIVTLSDGDDDPNGSGVTLDEVERAIAANRIPVHAIGFNAKPKGEQILARLARLSGGSYLNAGSERGIGGSYADLRLRINQAIVAHAVCSDCPLDGRKYTLEIRLASGTRVPGDLTVRMSPGFNPPPPRELPVDTPIEQTPEPEIPSAVDDRGLMSDWRLWAGVGGAMALLAAVIGFRVFRRAPDPDIPHGISGIDRERPAQPVGATMTGEPSAVAARARFTMVSGADKGRVFDIDIAGSSTLGRSDDCDLTIPGDEEISRQHARAIIKNGKLVIADLRSSHGTYVNGVPVYGERVVEDGDIIRMGRTELHVSI